MSAVVFAGSAQFAAISIFDASHVYWTDTQAGRIGRANLDGTGVNQSFVTGASRPDQVAVDGTHVYWANSANGANTIGRANLDGSGVNQSFISGAGGPTGVAVNPSYVYWVNFQTNTIGRANLDGSGVNQSLISGANGPTQVALDGAHVYWTNAFGNAVARANLDGGAPNQSFVPTAAMSQPVGVAVDGAHVYWSNTFSSPSSIGQANLDATAINQSFITGTSSPFGGVAVGAGASGQPTPNQSPNANPNPNPDANATPGRPGAQPPAPVIVVTNSKVLISHRFLVRILASGQERIRLVCPLSAQRGCSGTLQLVSRFGKSKTSHFALASGQSRVFRVRPSQTLLGYITRHHPKRITVNVLVANTGPGEATTSQRTIHIAPNHKR